MSDLYEFRQSITLFAHSIWKSWLLIMKLGACVALCYHLHHEHLTLVSQSMNCFRTTDRRTSNELRFNKVWNFRTIKSTTELSSLLLKFLLLSHVVWWDIKEQAMQKRQDIFIASLWHKNKTDVIITSNVLIAC